MSDQNSPKNNGDNSLGRMNRGLEIAKKKAICEQGNGSFSVPSATVPEVSYLVKLIGGKYICNCLDFKYKEMRAIEACKHIHAVKYWVAQQVEIKQEPKPRIFNEESFQCPKCASVNVVKFGKDAGKQVFKCKDCKYKFREISLLKKAHYSPELVSLTLDLYFSGTSLRKISRIISAHYNIDIGYTTIYAWIQKFVPKVSEYVNSLKPQLSESWHADEVFVKMQNGVDYRKNKSISFLWNVMDRKTRFMLASKLSPLRDRAGALSAMREAQKVAHGNFPEQIFCDSL